MIVIKKTKVIINLMLLMITFISVSCTKVSNDSNNRKEDIHQIISKVIDSIALHITPRNLYPPPPPRNQFTKILNKKDSLEGKKLTLNYINEYRVIAIDSNTFIPNLDYKKIKYDIINDENLRLINQLEKATKKEKIDLKKIKLKRINNSIYFDSITYFNPAKHIRKSKGGTYINIDYRFSFSSIIFNKTRSKAALYCSYRIEHRFPESDIYFLEKINNEWKINDKYSFIPY